MHHLDFTRLHTRGTPLAIHNLLSRMSPIHNVMTFTAEADQASRQFTQVTNWQPSNAGHFVFLVADAEYGGQLTTELLERVCQDATRWGIFYLLADLDQNTPFLDAFTAAGFRVWARQKIFRIAAGNLQVPSGNQTDYGWRVWKSTDQPAMQRLHRSIVPALFHNIEPVTRGSRGMVAYDASGNLLGYANLEVGPVGCWVQPMFNPETTDAGILRALLSALPGVRGRPIYLAVRSYQPWMQTLAEQIPNEGHSSQLMLTRSLAQPQFAWQTSPELSFENPLPQASPCRFEQVEQTHQL